MFSLDPSTVWDIIRNRLTIEDSISKLSRMKSKYRIPGNKRP